MQTLITGGMSPNASLQMRGFEGEPYLWVAVSMENLEMARLLLFNGADVNTRYQRRSALQECIARRDEDMFDLLRSYGASTTTLPINNPRYDTRSLCIHTAASVGSVQILRKLIEEGHDVEATLVDDGWTALFHSIGHEEALRALIHDFHANIHHRANEGNLAIHIASEYDWANCVEILLDAGLDVNVRGRLGRTALHWAAQEGSIGAVKVLLRRGADVTLQDEETSRTAREIARDRALEIAKEYHWLKDRGQNCELIVEILKDHES